MKIKKMQYLYYFICLLLIVSQAFANDYDLYEADLNRMRNEWQSQNYLTSEAELALVRLEQQKEQIKNALKVVKCAPSIPKDKMGGKEGRLFRFIRDNHEWYFHELGCDEDKLGKVCDEYASKNRQELEEFLRQSANRCHELEKMMHSCVAESSGLVFIVDGSTFEFARRNIIRLSIEQALAKIVLQNLLAQEGYEKCQERLGSLKQAEQKVEQYITKTDIIKRTAQQKKQELEQEFTKKQQEVNQIMQQEAAAYVQKYKAAIYELGLNMKDREAELKQAYINGINLNEVATKAREERVKKRQKGMGYVLHLD